MTGLNQAQFMGRLKQLQDSFKELRDSIEKMERELAMGENPYTREALDDAKAMRTKILTAIVEMN